MIRFNFPSARKFKNSYIFTFSGFIPVSTQRWNNTSWNNRDIAVLGETLKQFNFTLVAGTFTALEKHPIQSNFILFWALIFVKEVLNSNISYQRNISKVHSLHCSIFFVTLPLRILYDTWYLQSLQFVLFCWVILHPPVPNMHLRHIAHILW